MSRHIDAGEPPSRRFVERQDLPSVAVLPYALTSDGSVGEYFSEAMTAEIISSLSRFDHLAVIGVSSARRFRDESIPLRQIGTDLGARYLVKGTIEVRDQALTFRQSIYDSEDGRLIWSDAVRAHLADLFDVQYEIVGQIVNGIAAPIREAEIDRTQRARRVAHSPYDLMLRALPGFISLTRASFDPTRDLLQKAHDGDAQFATPVAMLARMQSLSVGQGWSTDRQKSLDLAMELALSAIELDPTNATALATAGHLHSYVLRKYDSAIDLFDRAIAACPSDAQAWSLSSLTLSYCDRAAEARSRAERAIRLSPLDSQSYHFFFSLGLAHYVEGNFEPALRWLSASVSENARYTASHKILVATLVALGRLSDAKSVAHRLSQLEPGFAAPGGTVAPMRDEAARAEVLHRLSVAAALL